MIDEQIQISKDSELMIQVISLIASYAVEKGYFDALKEGEEHKAGK